MPLSSQATASPSIMQERERRRANVSTISGKLLEGLTMAGQDPSRHTDDAPYRRDPRSNLARLALPRADARKPPLVTARHCEIRCYTSTQRRPEKLWLTLGARWIRVWLMIR